MRSSGAHGLASLLLALTLLLTTMVQQSQAFIPFDAESPHAHTAMPTKVLEERQGGKVSATAIASVATQVSPITTYYINSYIDGTGTYVPVTFTQTFAAVPDQWSSPSVGTIGLGTISGEVGVVKTTSK